MSERVLTDDERTAILKDWIAVMTASPSGTAIDNAGDLMLAVEAAVLAKVAVVLPGSYYMDPPDGGDVPIMEQLRRMAEDARGYREASAPGAVPVGEIRHRKGHPYAVLRRGYLPNGDTIPDGMPIYVVPPVPDPAGDGLAGEIAYQLTRRLVIDMPTARAAVDDAIRQQEQKR